MKTNTRTYVYKYNSIYNVPIEQEQERQKESELVCVDTVLKSHNMLLCARVNYASVYKALHKPHAKPMD